MKEYNFSKGVRGKFYQPDTQLNLAVYLDAGVLNYLFIKAKAKGVEVNEIVHDFLRKDIALIEGMN